jgi:hypothetical protein
MGSHTFPLPPAALLKPLAVALRADMKVYLGPPPLPARYRILQLCMEELAAKGILLSYQPILPYDELDTQRWGSPTRPPSGAPPLTAHPLGLRTRPTALAV